MKTKISINLPAIYQTLLVVAVSTAWSVVAPRYAPYIAIAAIVLAAYHNKPSTVEAYVKDTQVALTAAAPVLPVKDQGVISRVQADADALLPLVQTLGDQARIATAASQTVVGEPPPPVVNAVPAPAAQTVGAALVSPPVLPVVDGQSA